MLVAYKQSTHAAYKQQTLEGIEIPRFLPQLIKCLAACQ